jgi:hypothetical protein
MTDDAIIRWAKRKLAETSHMPGSWNVSEETPTGVRFAIEPSNAFDDPHDIYAYIQLDGKGEYGWHIGTVNDSLVIDTLIRDVLDG